MKLVTVYQTFSPADAQLVRSRLQASNLEAVILNELSSLSIDGYSMAAGGILVQVPEDQAEEARELIELNLPPPE
jgi:hypothetical protein